MCRGPGSFILPALRSGRYLHGMPNASRRELADQKASSRERSPRKADPWFEAAKLEQAGINSELKHELEALRHAQNAKAPAKFETTAKAITADA